MRPELGERREGEGLCPSPGYRASECCGIKYCVNDEVYEPSDDSALLLDIVEAVKGEKALEVGSGSGIISVKLAKLGAEVVSVDINP